MIQFLFGILVGAILVLAIFYVIYSNLFGAIQAPLAHPDQFVPLQLPPVCLKYMFQGR